MEHQHTCEAMVGHLLHIDLKFASSVAKGLGMPSMPKANKIVIQAQNLPVSAALQLIAKMKDTLEGRCIGIIVADGSDASLNANLKAATLAEGASIKLVAPKVGKVKLSDGSATSIDGQLAGTSSALFDVVAIILSKESTTILCKEAAAVDFVCDAFGHLKAIAVDDGGQYLLD